MRSLLMRARNACMYPKDSVHAFRSKSPTEGRVCDEGQSPQSHSGVGCADHRSAFRPKGGKAASVSPPLMPFYLPQPTVPSRRRKAGYILYYQAFTQGTSAQFLKVPPKVLWVQRIRKVQQNQALYVSFFAVSVARRVPDIQHYQNDKNILENILSSVIISYKNISQA